MKIVHPQKARVIFGRCAIIRSTTAVSRVASLIGECQERMIRHTADLGGVNVEKLFRADPVFGRVTLQCHQGWQHCLFPSLASEQLNDGSSQRVPPLNQSVQVVQQPHHSDDVWEGT